MGRELPASSRSGLWLWSDRCLRLRARGSLTRQTANAYLALSLSCAIVPASGLRTVQVFASLTRLSSSPNDLIPSHGHPLTRRPSHPHTHYTHIHKYCIYYSSPSLPRPIPPSSLLFPSNVPALPGRTGRALALCVSSPRIRSMVYIYL